MKSPFQACRGRALVIGASLASCVFVQAAHVVVPADDEPSIFAGPPFPKTPPPSQWVPGTEKGKIHSRWLAPFVGVTEERFGENRRCRIRWFEEDGAVAQEVTTNREDRGDYVRVGKTVYGVKERWHFDLPERPDYEHGREISCTWDSRTFIHVFHPEQGRVAADVYVLGKLVATVGPYWECGRVRLGTDGSLAMLIWKSKEKKRNS